MLGLPEALQRRRPRVLAAVPAPRAPAAEHEGARGRRWAPWGARRSPRPALTTTGPGPCHPRPREASAGSTVGSCVWEYVYAWVRGHVDLNVRASVYTGSEWEFIYVCAHRRGRTPRIPHKFYTQPSRCSWTPPTLPAPDRHLGCWSRGCVYTQLRPSGLSWTSCAILMSLR